MIENSPKNSRQTVKVEDLGRLIREKRFKERLTLKEVAERIQISPSTLSRLERQDIDNPQKTSFIPDVNTLTLLSRWLDIPIEGVVLDTQRSVPEVVEVHLRADRNLSPESAARIGDIFQKAYEQEVRKINQAPQFPDEEDNNNESSGDIND